MAGMFSFMSDFIRVRKRESLFILQKLYAGGGWNITDTSIVGLNIPGNVPSNIDVMRLNLSNGRERQVVLYWYQSRGGLLHRSTGKKYISCDRFNHKKKNRWFFVRLIAL
jgi:hypothetical protein